MSIGRLVIGPRKVVLVAKLDKEKPEDADQYLADDAVDVTKSDLAAYKESLFNPQHLSFFSDRKPTWFLIRPLTKGEKDGLENLTGQQRLEKIAKVGLLGVEGFQLRHEDGSITELPALVRKDEEVSPESWAALELTPTQNVILSTMIWHISETSIPLSKCCVSLAGQSGDQKAPAQPSLSLVSAPSA